MSARSKKTDLERELSKMFNREFDKARFKETFEKMKPNKKALDNKYSYQIDEQNIIHLFRNEKDCQQFLTNPLISAIYKIEELEKENVVLKVQLEALSDDIPWNEIKDKSDVIGKLTKAIEIIKEYMRFEPMIGTCAFYSEEYEKTKKKAEQFIKEMEK